MPSERRRKPGDAPLIASNGVPAKTWDTADLSALRDSVKLLEEYRRREMRRCFYALFPEIDVKWTLPNTAVFQENQIIHSRFKYPKHLEFFAATKKYRECAALSGNRVGKTLSLACYPLAVWATGEYPDWWPGRVFPGPISAWVAGRTNETTRDILQTTLLGNVAYKDGEKYLDGTGIMPGDSIGKPIWKQGVSNLVDTVSIKNVKGGFSTIGFKSYEQGRGAFEGTAMDVILIDEETTDEVYSECLIRTMTRNGIVITTFTAKDSGFSDLVLRFLPGAAA